MAFASRVRLGACSLKPTYHPQNLFNSPTNPFRLRLGVRQPGPIANHHRNLTTSRFSPSSRPTAYTGSTLKPLLGGSRSASTTTSQPARSPTRILQPNPHPDAAAQAAFRADLLSHEAELQTHPEQLASLRMEAVCYCYAWLATNFPREDGFVYWPMGQLPRDITFITNEKLEEGGEVEGAGTIPRDDTWVWLVGRQGDPGARIDGKKQGGVVCVAMLALPPAGVGGPVMAGTPVAEGTSGTSAMAAAERALLGYVKGLQDVGGHKGQGPMGELVEGSMAVVFMGADMAVYDYSRGSGFVDPPGLEFVEKRVDMEVVAAQVSFFLELEKLR